MKSRLFQTQLIVKKSNLHGYGVFALKDLRKGTLIEECYIIVCRGTDKNLDDFYFDARGKNVILTGFGLLYNHSDEPNADYTIRLTNRLATIKADRKIYAGEEIFISYGDDWFESRGLKAKHLKDA